MYLFTYLTVAGLSCSMWDLVPWPQIEPRPPAMGAQSLNCWTTREVPTSMLSWLHNSSYFPRSISQPRCDFCLTNARLHTLRSETVYLLCNFPAPAKWFHVQANSSPEFHGQSNVSSWQQKFWKSCRLLHAALWSRLALSKPAPQCRGWLRGLRAVITKFSGLKIHLHKATHGKQSCLLQEVLWLLVTNQKRTNDGDHLEGSTSIWKGEGRS